MVAPLAGAWIETFVCRSACGGGKVAPLAGAWIETGALHPESDDFWSRPSRARGLKLEGMDMTEVVRSCVAPLAGAWIETKVYFMLKDIADVVAPLAGAWIETTTGTTSVTTLRGRAPRGRVD